MPINNQTIIIGTANQVLANATSSTLQGGLVTLTLPQSIGTSSNPSFNTVASTVATGTAPFTVASTTPVANLSIGGTSQYSSNTLVSVTNTNAVYPLVLSPTSTTGEQSLLMDIDITYNPFTDALQLSSAGSLSIGTLTYTPVNSFFNLQNSTGTYVQAIIQNTNGGTASSADFIVNNELSTDTTYYGDFGMNSNTFIGTGALSQPGAVYLSSTTADLTIGTTTSNAIHFVVNSGATDAFTVGTAGQWGIAGSNGTAGQVFTSGGASAAPSWTSLSGVSVTSFSAGTTGFTPSSATTGAITLAGTLNVGHGGTGLTATPTNGQLLIGNGTGFTLASITGGTGLSVTPGAGTIALANTGVTSNVAGTNISVSSATGAVTIGITGTIAATNGGTGNAVYAVGDILYANTTTTLARLADVATGSALISGGTNIAPSWGKISLTTAVSGILPLANGGSNAALTAVNGGVVYSTGSAMAISAAGTANQVLQSNGAAAPTWTSAPTITGTNITGIPNTGLTNSSITVTGGTGLGVAGSPVSLGGTVTLSNTGVTSNVAGSGISVSGATGAVTVTNTGVTSAIAGANISVSSATGPVTIAITGTVPSATNIAAGAANSIPYQSAAGTTAFLAQGTGVLQETAGIPVWTTTPTLAGTNFSGIPNGALTNSTVTVTAGTGMSGGGTMSLGGNVTLTNAGVTSIVAGTGISISGATGAVTVNATNAGTVTSVSGSGGTTGLTLTGGPITAAGTLTLGGTLAIANGGTGQTTAAAAFNALNPMTTTGDLIYESAASTASRLPIGTTGQILSVVGGVPAWTTSSAAGVTSFSAGTTGLTPNTATTGVVTLAGTLAVGNGGTGLATTPTNGQIDIGDGTGFTRSTITAGTNITVTNTAGGITIGASTQQGSGTRLQQVLGNVAGATSTTAIYTPAALAGVAIANVGTIAGVAIANVGTVAGVAVLTGGQFTCTAFVPDFYVGQSITISGTLGGTGTITGYTNPTTYYVIATTANTNFTLSATPGGTPITTTAGTLTGLTYTPINSGYFTCTAFVPGFYNGQAITFSGTLGGTGTITGYTNPTTYYVIATTANTNFTLGATPTSTTPITTTAGTLTGLTYTPINRGYFTCTAYTNGITVGQVIVFSGTLGGTGTITGYVNPTTYYVIATTANTNFTLAATPTAITAITTTVGTLTGMVFTPGPPVTAGAQIWSQVFTPQVSTSKIVVQFAVTVTDSVNNVGGYVFVFRGNTCINVTASPLGAGANTPGTCTIYFYDTPGTTSTTTYSARVAGSLAGTLFVNCVGALATTLGGTLVSAYTITEFS